MHETFYAFQSPLKAHQSKLGKFVPSQFWHIFERFFGTTPFCHTLIGRGQLLAHGSEVSGTDQLRNPSIGEIEPSICCQIIWFRYWFWDHWVLSTELNWKFFAIQLSSVYGSWLSYSNDSCYQDLSIGSFNCVPWQVPVKNIQENSREICYLTSLGNNKDLSYAFDIYQWIDHSRNAHVYECTMSGFFHWNPRWVSLGGL